MIYCSIFFISFLAIESILSQTSGKYCVGNNITMADITLVPQVFNAKRYHVNIFSIIHYIIRFHIDIEKEFPIISRIDQELSTLPAFIEAHPSKQIDAPNV